MAILVDVGQGRNPAVGVDLDETGVLLLSFGTIDGSHIILESNMHFD